MMEKLGFNLSGHQNKKPPPPYGHSFPQVPPQVMLVEKAPDQSFVLQNALAVPPNSFHDGQYVICDGTYVFTAKVAPSLPAGLLGVGGPQRAWAQWPYRKEVRVESFDIFASGQGAQVYLSTIGLEIDFYSRNKVSSEVYEQQHLVQQFLDTFRGQIFIPGQLLVMERGSINFKVTVRDTSVVDVDGTREPVANRRGILVPQSEVSFVKAHDSAMQLRGASHRNTNILRPNFDFKSLGIGGLDEQFMQILRRAFISRMAARDNERIGGNHTKGLLLYGPPGTGKTLIARQIGKMLNAVEPKIVNGPEMLSKYVGASEENIRKLFKDAEDEYRAKGDDSNLHIIIFDELDAVFKQRGSRGDGTGVSDNLVNQLLSKMDGVNQLNNILVIGMTNRKDLIDSALMRPGRFEIQLEIPLPDKNGRQQIFFIHTKRMREERILAGNVDMDELAELTPNYSGAEIAGVVRAAGQTALTRRTTFDEHASQTIKYDDKIPLMVTREDFMRGLEDVKPAFGVSDDLMKRYGSGGMILYSPQVEVLLDEGRRLINAVNIAGTSLMSALYHGAPQTGKTAVAAHVALKSHFPFIRMISPESMIGMMEPQKIGHIQQIFNDAYRSEQSVIVIDDIETIIEWSDVGPRFSNSLVMTIKTLIRAQPPTDRPLLVLGTSSRYDVLERLDLVSIFTKRLYVNSVPSTDSLPSILEEAQFLDPMQRMDVVEAIRSRTGSNVLNLGIKTILNFISLTRESEDHAKEDFIDEIVDTIHARSDKFVM